MSEKKEPIVERLICGIGGKMEFRKCEKCPYLKAEQVGAAQTSIFIETTATGRSYYDRIREKILEEIDGDEWLKAKYAFRCPKP